MSNSIPDPDVAQIPEDLPPVQPPSAGFIVQLFVVPGLIVAGVVGTWWLFSKLGSGDQDWQSLVVELQHPNPHRRGRAELGLAQMLNADQKRGNEGQHLSTNPDLARALSDVLVTELKRGGQTDEELNYKAFLARTLGLFDLPDAVLPALTQAMQADHDREIRKNAIGALAVMTDRMTSGGLGAPSDSVAQQLLAVSTDADPLIRQLSAFSLGLFPQPAARERLAVLLEDSDPDTRINAAIGLARAGDSRGTGVFRDVLHRAADGADRGSAVEYEQFVALKNSLAAIERLAEKLAPEQRQELIPLLEPLATNFHEPKIRISAQTALAALKATETTER
jgi:hypothetical protein